MRGTTLLADAVASSVDEHARYGGVVPEVASRAHLEAFVPTVERACADAGHPALRRRRARRDRRPGLAGALLVGDAGAKALALALDKPLYGVNHLTAHVAVDQLEHGRLPEPCVALLVSGGHSSLLLVHDLTAGVEPLGRTVDDAAGEAFDKVARLLGLPFPGGPYVDRAARDGDPTAIAFPRGLSAAKDLVDHPYDFSFSGLKTAVARWVEQAEKDGRPVPLADVAASFQDAVVDVLVAKTVAAAAGARRRATSSSGAGSPRTPGCGRSPRSGAQPPVCVLRVPRPGLCTDNGAMVAALGAELVRRGVAAQPAASTSTDSSMAVTQVVAR